MAKDNQLETVYYQPERAFNGTRNRLEEECLFKRLSPNVVLLNCNSKLENLS